MMVTFVLMDRDSRKVHAVEPGIVAPYQSDFNKKLIRGPKYANLEEPISKDYHVRFYDLDMNGHVNNSKYLDWIFEVMGADFFDQVYSQENQPQVCQGSSTRWGDYIGC